MDPTRTAARDRQLGYLCAGLLVMIWAGFILFSRFGAAAQAGAVRLTPWDLAALRFGVSGLIAAALWLGGGGRGLAVHRAMVLAVFAGYGFALPAYSGYRFAPAAHSAVLMPGMLPFLVAGAGWLVFRDPFGRARRWSLGIAAAGILLIGIESYGLQAAPEGAWRGDLLFLTASTCWATYTVLARRWRVTPTQAIVAVGLGTALTLLPVWAIALPSRMREVALWEVVAQGAYQGLLSTVAALFLYTRAIALLGAGRLTIITALTPGLAGVLAGPLLGEWPGVFAVAGLALVSAAVMVGVGRAPAVQALR